VFSAQATLGQLGRGPGSKVKLKAASFLEMSWKATFRIDALNQFFFNLQNFLVF
jgi:hypothetical protein